jgi:hypothetical protein
MGKYIALTLIFLSLVLFSAQVFAQATASAAIAGTVTDPSNAVLTGAQVTVTNKGTGETRTATTNSAGAYRFDLLPVGHYTLKIVKAGFQSTSAPDIELMVGRTATLNMTMKLGSETQTVEVTSDAPLVDQQKSDVALSITPREVQDLPLNGRDFGNLAYLAPGARPVDSYDPTKNRVAVFSVDGGAGRNVNVTVNGVDNKDNTVGGPVMQFPLEAIQEFNISTQRFSAANGRSEGAAVNVITKAGNNNFHGSLYMFDTETALNAIDKLTEDAGGAKRDFSRQQFGGSIGGPIRKDSDFLFFALERTREHTALAVSGTSFDQLVLAEPLGAKPAHSLPTPYFDWRYTGRYDHRFNDRENLFFTYANQNNSGLNDQATNQSDLTAGNTTTNQLILSNLTLNSVLSNTVVNSITAGFQYWNNKILADVLSPYFTFPDGTNFGTNPNVPQQSFQRKWQFKDDLAITKGNHGFKMGVDYLWEPQLGGYFEFNPTLEVDFNQSAQEIAALPAGFATAGIVNGMTIANGDPSENLPGGAKMLGLYFQDDWKIAKRLTLNLGFRWDKDYNLIGGGAQQNSRTYLQLKAIGSPYAGLPHDDNKDFSPRVGFAWDLTGTGRHVLRGGYGLYFGQTFLNIPLFMIQQANPTIFATVFSINTPPEIVPGTGIPLSNYRYGIDPLPTIPPPATSLADGTVGRIMDPHYRNPYSQQFNVGYAFSINTNNVVELEYVHELGLHESKTININPLIPGDPNGARVLDSTFAAAGLPLLGRIDDEQSIDRSRYDGMNLSYRRRLSKRVSINSAYVLSRAVCYRCYLGAASFRNRPSDPFVPLSPADFGYAPSDERHRFTFSGIFDLPWGFQISPIFQAASARPYDPLSEFNILGYGQSAAARPAVVPVSNPSDFTTYADPAAAAAALASGQGRLSKFNSLRGSPFVQLDLRASKNFKFGEKYNLRLISQFFDVTNRANYGGNYTGVVTDPNFRQPAGYITPSGVIIPQSFRAEFGAEFRF